MRLAHDQDLKSHYVLLFRGDELSKVMRRIRGTTRGASAKRVQCFSEWREVGHVPVGASVYIIASLAELNASEVGLARGLKAANKRYLLFSEQFGPESISEYTAELDVRSPQRIHTPRLAVDSYFSFCARLVCTLCASESHQAILDAWWELDRFVVISAAFQRLKIGLDLLPSGIRNASVGQRHTYEIDQDGDQVYWPELDVHMGWPQFEQAVDPMSRLRSQQKDTQFNVAYGSAVRQLREFLNLSQQDITELDERTVRRIEQGETRATASALGRLAVAHGMTTNEYLAELAKRLR